MEKVTIRAVHSFFPSHPHPCARSARAGQCRDRCPLPPVTWRNWTTGPLGARKRQPLEKPAPVRRTPWPLELPSLRSPDLLPHFHPSHRLPSAPLPPIPFLPCTRQRKPKHNNIRNFLESYSSSRSEIHIIIVVDYHQSL